jgi:sterol desaturase/sphingolipid hydroxylase (fatty acid hydroxylase superfamily)
LSPIAASLVAAFASFVVLAIIFVPLERLFPARGQPILRKDVAIDALFFAGQYVVWNAASLAILAKVDAFVTMRAPEGWHAWLAARPLWLVAFASVVLGDMLVYWFHRACHASDFLWRFHAVHHSSERLDWLAAHREHPLDGIATQLCQNLPAFLLGFPVEVLAAFIAFRGMWAIFIHSNVRLPLGPLRWIFGAPELHRWHHASVGRTVHNFANVAPWLDVVFGTHHLPEEDDYALGLDGPWPRGYLAQLAQPFVLTARTARRWLTLARSSSSPSKRPRWDSTSAPPPARSSRATPLRS